MGNLRFCCALLGATALTSAVTAAAITIASPTAAPAAARTSAQRPVAAGVAQLASLRSRRVVRRAAVRHAVRPRPQVVQRTTAVRIGATPSLYEHTASMQVLRAQGCAAGSAGTNGLVILDFGKLDYGSRWGYGTITFGDTFASNQAITWAMKSYARGYSQCLPHGSTAQITLARGTSNYDPTVPSTWVAGRLWAGATVALGNYLKRHQFVHVTAAAADDVEPAWDPAFGGTYDFFRGYHTGARGYLLYDFGSLDGGVGAIWSLRQVYYVTGGMPEARVVPEIYNRAMAGEWADATKRSVTRYGRPIQLAGVMTQHWTNCSGCGYTAPMARHTLRVELAARSAPVPVRALASVTNIGAATAN